MRHDDLINSLDRPEVTPIRVATECPGEVEDLDMFTLLEPWRPDAKQGPRLLVCCDLIIRRCVLCGDVVLIERDVMHEGGDNLPWRLRGVYPQPEQLRGDSGDRHTPGLGRWSAHRVRSGGGGLPDGAGER